MSVGDVVAFRHAHWDTPWWVNANRNAGRYNRVGQGATQYWCLHPLGVTAEFLRQLGPAAAVDLDSCSLRMWTARVPLAGVLRVTSELAAAHGLGAEELVGDDHAPTQAFADRLRAAGTTGLIAPSAALPGTENLVLFGPRLRLSYLQPAMDRQQVPTAHVLDGPPVAEVIPQVCWRGTQPGGEAPGAGSARFVDRPPPRRGQ